MVKLAADRFTSLTHLHNPESLISLGHGEEPYALDPGLCRDAIEKSCPREEPVVVDPELYRDAIEKSCPRGRAICSGP